MTKPIPFDEQIVAALTESCTSLQAAAVHAEAELMLGELTGQADAADVASLSPLATAAKARELRKVADDHRFEADRMEASVSALSARVADLKDAERRAAQRAEHNAALVVRDALADDIARNYPRLVAEMTELAKRIAESDDACKRLGINESAESIGRGIPGSFYMNGGPVHRIMHINLGMPKDTRMAWEYQVSAGWTWRGLTAAG